jgi:hypothetical protein
VDSKAYFRVEDYVPASLIERMTALQVQVEVSEMHRLSSELWRADAEMEFLRVRPSGFQDVLACKECRQQSSLSLLWLRSGSDMKGGTGKGLRMQKEAHITLRKMLVALEMTSKIGRT